VAFGQGAIALNRNDQIGDEVARPQDTRGLFQAEGYEVGGRAVEPAVSQPRVRPEAFPQQVFVAPVPAPRHEVDHVGDLLARLQRVQARREIPGDAPRFTVGRPPCRSSLRVAHGPVVSLVPSKARDCQSSLSSRRLAITCA
jgi:hypothetical protein